jgi:hypothetical protein
MNTINDHKEGFGEKKRTAKPKGAKDNQNILEPETYLINRDVTLYYE